MKLLKTVKTFIEAHWDQTSPLLLGYSGGPDSKALLYLLLEAKVHPLHLAHVDHGWREESRQEALQLEEEAKKLGLCFHQIRLEEKPLSNLEDFARQKRLEFFSSLLEKVSFQALLLGHQKDDLAETALKRLLEGAHLAYLGGLSPAAKIGDLPIWRPLLSIGKKEILDYVEHLNPLQDKTNEDPRFLRTKLRQELLPSLAASFGKEVTDNLALLSERAYELKDYLDSRTFGAWEKRAQGSWGIGLSVEGLARLEVRHLIQKGALAQGVCMSRKVLEPLIEALLDREAQKKFSIGKKFVLAYHGWFFLVESSNFNARKFLILNNIQTYRSEI